MRSVLDELHAQIHLARDLVVSIAPVREALLSNADSRVQQYLSIRRRFDYSAFIIAVYASFEKFAEDLVDSYVSLEASRVAYSSLPEKLQKKHLFRTADMLARGRVGFGRYVETTKLALVQNLLECLEDKTGYKLNKPAVIAHDNNLRIDELDKLFAPAGIEDVSSKVRKCSQLTQWFAKVNHHSVPEGSGIPQQILDERVRDLVDRRNLIAHRGGNPDDLLGPDDMDELLDFVEALSSALFSVVVGHYLQSRYQAEKGLPLVIREGPIKNGSVVVVDHPAEPLRTGQPVFTILASGEARWGRISSLQVDDQVVSEVLPGMKATDGVGVAVDLECHRTAKLVAIRDEDPLVWGPRRSQRSASGAGTPQPTQTQ